ncbi:germin-like protein subfamily 1 member 7 [Salvia splendens]|uniref:germin-like protein subfamily 1 member 7 n=1 Tax=Salvia splendens TaxID=180675 RepID=UPI001C253FA8|nr:germin-like protein subfamily 1 member 7 [Salvia splendens]
MPIKASADKLTREIEKFGYPPVFPVVKDEEIAVPEAKPEDENEGGQNQAGGKFKGMKSTLLLRLTDALHFAADYLRMHPGDVFVFPQGLIHFQFNVGKTNAVAFASFGSQNPGTITVANAVFGSDPKINPDVLAKAFQVEKNIIDYLQAQFWSNYN